MNAKKFVDNFEEYVIAVLICGMILFEAVNALLGAVGAAAHGLPQELAIYCYVWIAFLASSFCAKKGCDVTVGMLADKYSAGVKRVLNIVCIVLNLFVYACLFIGALGFVAATAAEGSAGKLTGLPLVVVYVSSILGFGLCLVRNVQKLIPALKAPEAK